jgi:hypothetical protein
MIATCEHVLRTDERFTFCTKCGATFPEHQHEEGFMGFCRTCEFDMMPDDDEVEAHPSDCYMCWSDFVSGTETDHGYTEDYESFGPVLNPDGSPSAATLAMFRA